MELLVGAGYMTTVWIISLVKRQKLHGI